MSDAKKKIMVIYPAAYNEGNVGTYRVKRIIKAFSLKHIDVCLVQMGEKDSFDATEYGSCLTIQGKMSYGALGSTQLNHSGLINNLKKFVKKYIFTPPDITHFWCRRVFSNKKINALLKEIDIIITTSPPETIHCLAHQFKKRYPTLTWIMDMRDGWNDEPLSKISSVRRYFEKIKEKKCVNSANIIVANTNKWRDAFVRRYPSLSDKVHVITNAVDDNVHGMIGPARARNNESGTMRLLYMGAFTLSRFCQNPKKLFLPLARAVQNDEYNIKCAVVGRLNESDKKEIELIQSKYSNIEFEIFSPVKRQDLKRFVENADGLLNLSLSEAALPSKFFEYLSFKLPILNVCFKDSSLAEYSYGVDLCWSYYIDHKDNKSIFRYLESVKHAKRRLNYPTEFSQQYFFDRYVQLFEELYNSKLIGNEIC